MKELEIQAVGKPLGRPPKESKTQEYQSKMAEAVGEHNEIEAILVQKNESTGRIISEQSCHKRLTAGQLCAILDIPVNPGH